MATQRASSPRTRVRRLPEKAVYDRTTLDAVLDASVVAHVGIATDGQPFVMPCGYARDGDHLLLHGSTGSRLFRALGAGAPACVTVTVLDGLVVATSLFESSMHYRSAVVLGSGAALTGDAKRHALDVLADHLLPGRRAEARPPNRKELAATSVIAIPIEEWSVKVSDSPPAFIDDDAGWSNWAGVVPLRLRADPPVTDRGGEPPAYLETWYR
ncbi:MAG TPA: pyridoxamine 5'-phosphate oxidase family protein [Mycobacteriales bacterium]|nr:pyridoxamine 5'-phosphate oxidase family protein [Mycobacteriales bacterium]